MTSRPRPIGRLSVIVPVYNDAAGIRTCLDGLAAQTDPDFEVVLVDDGSRDDTPTVLRESGHRVVTLPRNKGQAVARNRGAAVATGEVLVFLDADTLPPPEWLATHRRLLDRHPEASMICSGYSHALEATAAARFAFAEQTFRRRGLPRWIDSSSGSNCAVRRPDFDAVGGYPEYYLDPRRPGGKACAAAEDSELGWLLARSGRSILWTPDNPVAHRFRRSVAGYLRQQAAYSRFLTVSLFRFPDKWRQRGIYAGERVLPQVVVMGAILAAPVALLAGPPGAVVMLLTQGFGLLWMAATHRRFLAALDELEGPSRPVAGALLLTSRVAWGWGILRGLLDGGLMRMRSGAPDTAPTSRAGAPRT